MRTQTSRQSRAARANLELARQCRGAVPVQSPTSTRCPACGAWADAYGCWQCRNATNGLMRRLGDDARAIEAELERDAQPAPVTDAEADALLDADADYRLWCELVDEATLPQPATIDDMPV